MFQALCYIPMMGGGLSFSSLRGSARKMKTKVSEVERGGVIPCKVRELVRSRVRTRSLASVMLSFPRRCLWPWVGDVWRGEIGGRQAGRGSKVRGPGGEKPAGRERESRWDGWPGRRPLPPEHFPPLLFQQRSGSTCRGPPPTGAISESHPPEDCDA